MIANGSRAAQVALYNYARGGVEGSLGNVIVEHEAGPGGTNAIVTGAHLAHRLAFWKP